MALTNTKMVSVFPKVIKFLTEVSLWRTFYFNLHYFPVSTAMRLPVFIFRHFHFHKMKGRIIIDAPVSTGMMKFGAQHIGIKDKTYPKSVWEVSGDLVLKGRANIAHSSKICIEKNAKLTLGDGLLLSENVEIICKKEISFGRGCMVSWDTLFMDSDLHDIMDADGKVINPPQTITIGNHVWIGCRNTILKGVTIGDNNIIAANSLVTRSVLDTSCIVGGHGKSLEVLKRNVDWRQ